MPPPISPCTLYFQKLESLAYILSLILWVYLHSNLCSGLQKTHLFCTRVRFGRSRSFKVDDFGANGKRVCDFLLVGHCDYGPILHRFWDTATYFSQNCLFSYRSLIRRPHSLCCLWNIAPKLTMWKIESWGIGVILQWRRHDCSMSYFDTVPACDSQTDWRTDGFTIASTAISYRFKTDIYTSLLWTL